MKNVLKKSISILLITVMVLCSAPLSGFVGLELPEIGGLSKLADSVSEFFADLAPKAKAEETPTSGTCGENLTWTFDESTGELVISGTGGMDTYWSYSSIPWYSSRSLIKSVTIGNGVTSIGRYAFYDCDSLASVTIGNGVTSIGENAFCSCYSLENVYYTGDLAGWCGIKFVDFKSNPTYDHSVNLYINGSLLEGDIVIPDSVTSIGENAFYNCDSLTSITIPDSVTSIGENAFYDCDSLTSITIPDSVTSIGGSAFYGCYKLASVTIGNGVTSIGSSAFKYCDSLTSVTIPDSVTSIGDYAFYYCDRLASITIPDSVTSIGDYAFYSCDRLASITIPDSVTSIGKNAFDSCDSLENVYYTGDLAGWCGIYFENYASNLMCYADNLYINGSLLEGNIVIPDSVTSIGEYAFYSCDSLASITIPDSVTSIGDRAFSNCTSLTSVTVGSGNLNYSSDECGVLFKKDKTELIQYPAGNRSSNYEIPDGVKVIKNYAFEYCRSLRSVTIPVSVTTIENYAFKFCHALSEVRYFGTEEEWETIDFGEGNLWIKNLNGKEDSVGSGVAKYADLDAEYDKFVYVGLDVVEVANGELTDGHVQPGDWLEYRVTILSDMYIGNSSPCIVYDRDFFDVRVITSTTPSTSETFERADYEGNKKFSDGTLMNPNHPVAPQNGDIASYNTLTAFPYTNVRTQLGFCEIDAETYANWDLVRSNLGVTITVANTNFEMKTDDWITSWYVRVREDLEAGEIGSSFSPESIWKHNINPSTGTGDKRRLADICTADELGIYTSSKTMAIRYNDIQHVLLDDTYHTFIIDEPYTSDTKFNLTFEVDGETVEGYPMEFEYGTKIPVPENPSKEGYSFDGWIWKSDAGEIFSEPKKMPGFNVTATPKWIADENIVYLLEIYKNDENGQYPAAPSETVTFSDGVVGETITVDYTAPDGFTVDADKSTLSGVISATDPLVLKAYLTRNSYTVTVDIDGETTVYDVFYDTPVSVEIPSKKGHSFNVTWADVNGEAIEPPSVMPAGNLTATVVYTPNTYFATFNANGGEFADGEETATVKVTFGESIAVPETPVCEGYNFIGWTPSIPEAMPDYNLEFLAVWEEGQKGDGTAENPYQITDKYELDSVRNDLNAHYILMNDIEFTEADFAEGGDFEGGFIPIGSYDEPFTGVFDGNTYSLKNIKITLTNYSGSNRTKKIGGLFGYSSGEIKNLNMNNLVIDEKYYATGGLSPENSNYFYCGGIAGYNTGIIKDCSVSGNVSVILYCVYSSGYLGGIVGRGGEIISCKNNATIYSSLQISPDSGSTEETGCSINVGGIAGYAQKISLSSNHGTVTGYAASTRVGGIAGSCSDVKLSYNTNEVSGGGISGDYFGGIVATGSAENCYNTAKVIKISGTAQLGYMQDYSGGIAGDAKNITNCYNIGEFVSTNYTKGIAPYGTLTNAYYLSSSDSEDTGNGTGRTNEKMQQQETYAGFDFNEVWFITDKGGYPYPQLKANPYTKYVPSTSVSFESDSAALKVDETANINITVEPADTTDNVTFTSSDENIVTVDKDGKITAVGAGTATITATTSSGLTATIEITIKAVSYQLIWNVDGEKTVETLRAGDVIVAPADPVKEGYTFAGWTPTVPDVMPGYDLEFMAIFEKIWEGDGTAENPYQVTTKSQLDNIRNAPEAHYVLMNNITFTSADFAEGGIFEGGFKSICSYSEPFVGDFDGQGYTISGLTLVPDCESAEHNTIGLFASSTGTIKNLNLTDVTVDILKDYGSNWYCGGIAAISSGLIENCSTSGKISLDFEGIDTNVYAGGICGKSSGTILNCRNSANVESYTYDCKILDGSSSSYAGGICGYGADISYCFNSGMMYPVIIRPQLTNSGCFTAGYAGGIAGFADTVTTSYNTGDQYVKIKPYGGYLECFAGCIAGGVTGYVKDCYNNGGVPSAKFAQSGGGGYSYGEYSILGKYGTTITCYNAGGIEVGGTETNCYCISDKTSNTNENTFGSEKMKKQESYVGFDFDYIWYMPTEGNYLYAMLRPYVPPVPSTSISFTSDTVELEVGDSETLGVTLEPSDSTDRITYTTSDSNVVTVDKYGKITATGIGTATVTATTSSGYSASCTVTVIQKIYQLIWNVDGETTVVDLIAGDAIVAPADPVKDGHTFMGWSPEIPEVMPESDLEFIAVWERKTFTLSFEFVGESPEVSCLPQAVQVIYDDTFTLPEMAADGYLFDCWYDKNDVKYPAGYEYAVREDTTLRCRWSYAEYILSFNSNGGEPVADITARAGEIIVLPATTRAGYNFHSWTDSKSNQSFAGEKITMPAYNLSITAVWREKLKGNGTAANPYQIYNKYDLDSIRFNLNAHYILMNDIEFDDADFVEGGDFKYGFTIIGTKKDAFKGVLEGRGYTIKNIEFRGVKIISSGISYRYSGLFSKITGTVRNLNFSDMDTPKDYSDGTYIYIGTVAGHSEGTIENCKVSGVMDLTCGNNDTYNIYAGGIVGCSAGTIINCHNTMNITADLNAGVTCLGGVAGLSVDVSGCSNTGTVYVSAFSGTPQRDGNLNIGGISGHSKDINMCYNTGDVTGYHTGLYYSYGLAGGISGFTSSEDGSSIRNCYNTGDIYSESKGGQGYIQSASYGGITSQTGEVYCCYDLANKSIGGSKTNHCCYYRNTADTEDTGRGAGRVDEKMRQQSTFIGFDFDEIWFITSNGDYPYPQLRSNPQTELVPSTSVSFGSASVELEIGETATPEVTVEPADTTDNVTFTSSDENVVTVDKDGKITAVGTGTATITATTSSGHTATIEITVKAALYQLTWNVDGEKTVETLRAGDAIVAPADPVKEGYTFAGWTPVVPDVMPESDVEFTATWTANKYKVKWNIDGMTMTQTIACGSEIPVPDDPEKDGFEFAGWSPAIPETMPAEDITFTAMWNSKGYVITWIVDGVETQTSVPYGDAIPVPENPTKEGHTFNGWVPEIPETMPANDLTFTADFAVNSYYVTWIVDGAATVSHVKYGDPIVPPENPVKDGFRFAGWTPAIPASMPGYDMAFVATWETDYKVDFSSDSVTVEVGGTTQLEVIVSPEPTTPLEITWSSSDESIATVDENGLVTAVSCGSAIITAEADGKTATVTVNVAHKYTSVTTEATCTQNGFTTYTCSVCGDVYTDNVVEAKGHSYKETVIDSTCTGTGYTQYECTVCGDTYTDNETPAAGHKYDPIVIKPTCTSGGYTINMCSVCGMAYKSDAVDALGHNYTEKVVEATCVSGGYTEYSCLNCGESYQDNFVESGSHDYVATNTVAATCTENGYTEYTCSRCNDTYNGDIVEAKGHTITSVTNAATCENGGYTLNVCNVCNNYTSITNQTPALGHEYIDKVVPATCESDGYTLHTCVRGDHVYTSDETSALGHNYEATEIKATCIQNGCVLNICLNCGRVNKSGATSAYGHSFNNWITVTEAGENTEGLQTRNCKNCGYTEEKILPMLQRTTYTATFVADGKVVSNVEFLKGATEITEPEVPQKHRYSGKWEEYALTNSDITINAEYELIDLDNLSGIDFGKSATYNASTGEATINLYAASEAKTMISQTSKKIPLDIVLVVDQSGSMAEKLGGKVSKQEALIESANDFVNSVYADASSNGVDHRIAVVGFGMGNRSNGYEYPAYYNTEILTTGGNPVNMKNAKVSDYASSLMPVNENGALNADIVNAINSIDAKGATAADFGLSMACNVFANNTETEGRQRIVVFMTDGEPTYNSGYEVNVANAAVQQAYQLKNTYDAFVYSVGIFDENKAGEHLVKFMNHVSSNCKTARSAPGNFDIESDKYFITVDNTDALSSVFTEIVVENITRTTEFDNITLIDTVSEYFTLTSQQEKALRISAIEKFGVKNSDITVTRNADGTTTIEIKSIHPEEIGDKFVVELDFNVSANENASVAGDYATNTDDAGIIVGDAENYECIFNAPSVNIPSDRNAVVFKVNGEIYAIKSVEPNGKITAPATDFIGDYKFTGWNIPEGTLANLPKTEFDATLVNQDCVVIWNTDSGTETVTYAPGDVIDVPDVAPDKNGDAFRRWNGEVPVTMPAESIEFTAVYGDHEHEYTAEIIKSVTCLENGETKYTCSICGGSYTETVRCAGEHTWKAITSPADKSGHTPERFKCEVCGVSDDRTLEYMLLDDENGNIVQEFNYVDENGNNCQPDGDLTITVPLDEYEDAQTVDVYRINDDGTRTKCDSRFEEGVLEFNTDHFSTYIFEPVYQCMIQGNHPDSNNDSSCDVCRKWLGVTLTWIVDGKKTDVKAKTGTELELPETPLKEGYTFVGWTPAVPETVPGTDVTFTAVFEVNTYTVKWMVDGNETTETYEYSSEIKVPAKPEKNGYYFAGWTPAVPSKMPAKDMTFTAKFADYDVSKIKVTIATPETRTISYRESITLYANAANLPEGAKIKWNADSKDVSLEASKDGRTCTVTSVSNGNVVIIAYIVDANGDVITNENGARISDSEGITSKVTLWSIIVYAFKQMFSGNPFLSFIFKDLFN